MAITTTENLNQSGPPVCSRCGHPGSLMRKDANGNLVHFDQCPKGPAPEPEEALIAHDPLGSAGDGALIRGRFRHGADARAIKRLQERGHNLRRVKQWVNPLGVPVTLLVNSSGRVDGRTTDVVVESGELLRGEVDWLLPVDEIMEEQERSVGLGVSVPPPAGTPEDSGGAVHVDGPQALQARKRKPEPESDIDWPGDRTG